MDAFLTPDLVRAIHDEVLNPRELPGDALNKSLEGALARVDNRLAYGLLGDVFDLAAAYTVAIATGHVFNDGNKRTAHQTMDVVLTVHGIEIDWDTEEVGRKIIAAAQGIVDEVDLGEYLRGKAGG